MNAERASYLKKAKRVVVKIGSSLLTDEKKRAIRTNFLRHLAEQVKGLQDRGVECLIVTSGAIAAGMFETGLSKRPKEIAKLQALAAVGQSRLMHAYSQTFKRSKLKVAQVLLTRDDLSHRHRYANAHNTLMELFRNQIIPVINENDTVAVEEIKFGNNDTLGVLVAHLAEADLLVLLTDTDGFFSEDPRLNPKAKLISDVFKWEPHFEKSASRSKTLVGTGGMQTKIQAAKSMMKSGSPMMIANGKTRGVLTKLMAGETIGTFFYPASHKMNSRKRWLAWSVKPKGEIVVDEGAQRALSEKDKSLLPGGIREIRGNWNAGEVVRVVGLDQKEIAKGIVNFASHELEKIKGLKTTDVFQRLGRQAPDEVIHRDNLVKSDPS